MLYRVNEISRLSTEEWVGLKASLLAVEQKKYQCSYCLRQFQGRKDGSKMLESTQKIQGCKEIVSHPVHKLPLTDGNGWNTGSIDFTRCPGNFMMSDIGHWIEVTSQYERGVMPYSGSLSQQPAKVMEIIGVISDWKAERKKKAEEAQARKAKSGRR